MTSIQEFHEKRKIPPVLVRSIIMAREGKGSLQECQNGLNEYLENCQKEGWKPKDKWINLLEWLAKGTEMMIILEELQVGIESEEFLKWLEALKAHGFSDDFLNQLISEIPSESLSDTAKDNLREWIPLKIEPRFGPGDISQDP